MRLGAAGMVVEELVTHPISQVQPALISVLHEFPHDWGHASGKACNFCATP